MKRRQFFGLIHREMMRFLKVPAQTLGTPIISTTLYLLIFGVSIGGAIRLDGNQSYLAFLIPGLITMSLTKNAFDNTTSSLVSGKYTNELQDYRTSPFSTTQLIWGISLASLIRGCIVGALTYAIGFTFLLYSERSLLAISHPLLLILFIFAGGLSFGQLGITIAMRSKSFEHVGIISSFILIPLIYLGGVFFSLSKLHPIWQFVSHFNPLLYTINGIRYSIDGASDVKPLFSLLVNFAFFIATHITAHFALKKGDNYYR